LAKVFSDYREILEPLAIDGPSYLHEAITTGKRVMCEGAQGLMLDVDFGTYPFVTSSNPSPGGVCTGLGLPPMAINRILGVAKAYTTRVGAGPFPTEFEDDLGDRVRELGGEYGATTGRPRRCGWFDAALIRRSAQLSGATDVAITKLDVLDTLEELRICTGYKWNGKELDIFPFGLGHEDQLEPIYETLPGWQTPLSHMRHTSDLPERAINYVKRIEELCGIRVSAVSVGAERSQTILIKEISFFD
jgi:adenylosuccinate synthase